MLEEVNPPPAPCGLGSLGMWWFKGVWVSSAPPRSPQWASGDPPGSGLVALARLWVNWAVG